MTATEMAKKIGMRGTYKSGNFELEVFIVDLKDIVGEGTMCLIVSKGTKGEEWVPLRDVKKIEEEKAIYAECSPEYSVLHYKE